MAEAKRRDSKNRLLKEGEYERKNGTYEYRWRDKRGKRRNIYAKTLDELRAKEKEAIKNMVDEIVPVNKNMTINDLFQLWLDIKRGLKDNTLQNYIYMYNQFVANDIGKLKVCDVTRIDIRKFYNRLVEVSRLKTSTVDSIHTVLHQVLNIAVENDYRRYNPSDNALTELKKAHARDTEKRTALTVEEQTLFENFLTNNKQYNRWKPIFTFMLYTGMRVGEVTGLRWKDVDFDEEIIHVRHTLVYYNRGGKNKCNFAINSTKTIAGERTIPMLPIVKEALIEERDYQITHNIKCQSIVDGYTDFIFLNKDGFVQHQGTLNKALRRIIRDCNYEVYDGKQKGKVFLPQFSNHVLRHTFATRVDEHGVNNKVLQSILGHSDPIVTNKVYKHATEEFKKAEIFDFYESVKKIRCENIEGKVV